MTGAAQEKNDAMRSSKYEQMGMAALLPGMTYAIELVQKQLDEMRAQLDGIVNGDVAEPKKQGRAKGSKMADAARSGWPDDPEERRREMKRRIAKRAKNAEAAGVNLRAKIAHGQKAAWASYTPAQRKRRIAAVMAGKMAAKAKHVNGAAA